MMDKEKIRIFLDRDAPCTMMIMGALLSGGDYMSLAKQLAESSSNKEKEGNNAIQKD